MCLMCIYANQVAFGLHMHIYAICAQSDASEIEGHTHQVVYCQGDEIN